MERCRWCGKKMDSFGGYCLWCEKIAADAQDELTREFVPEENMV